MNQPIAILGGCTVAAFDGGVQVPIKYAISGGSVSFVFPSVVMALDFHDRLKPGANFFPNITVYADNNGNAIMSSGRIPLYQDPSHNG